MKIACEKPLWRLASIPQSKNSHKISVPWWNTECALAVKNKKHAFNRMRRTRRSIDILIFKRRRSVARKVILAAKQQSWRNYCTSINTNTKLPMVWRTIKNSLVLPPSLVFHNLSRTAYGQTTTNTKQTFWATIPGCEFLLRLSPGLHKKPSDFARRSSHSHTCD